MELNKPLNFLKILPNKLNGFYYKKSKHSLKISNKSKSQKSYDPVTNFDRSFEKYIRATIEKRFPNDGIIGEEFKDKKSKNYFSWSIDPIDGTKAFVIGVPTWSNLISLSFKGEPVFGLANFPELNKYYINDKKKSYVYKKKKKSVIRCSHNSNLTTAKIIGNFHGTQKESIEKKFIKKFGLSLRLASFDALNYCLLAEGKVDAVIESNLKPFDILPLIPIVKKSGGTITNWKNKGAENGGNILATSNKKLHYKILNVIKSI